MMVQRVQLALLDLKVMTEQLVQQDILEQPEQLALQVYKELQVLQAPLVILDQRVLPVLQVK
jgi:hypothetical protein